MERFDCVVVGAGGIGSAVLSHAARRGARVLGLDRFPPGHDRGSSHGDTRLIRLAYFEHPDYVPLLHRAFEGWAELERRCGRTLYTETGLLEAGPPDRGVVPGVLRAAREHGLAVDEMDAAEAARRFPGLCIPDGLAAVYEQRAGFLAVEECVRVHAAEAEAAGAQLRTGVTVEGLQPSDGGVLVRTNQGEMWGRSAVVTAGAWASRLLRGTGVELEVLRKPLFWFGQEHAGFGVADGFPCFLVEQEDGRTFYGFPDAGEGLKAAEHSGGRVVADPLTVDRELDQTEEADVRQFLQQCLPGAEGPLRKHVVCMYTMSPDQHFIVDRAPGNERAVFAAGLSGHGFKFAPVLGQALAEMALDGGTAIPVGFLGLARSADGGLR